MMQTITIDARGLRCPLPVLKAEKQLDALSSGDQIILLADDPIAAIDIPVLCNRIGASCIVDEHEKTARFTITK